MKILFISVFLLTIAAECNADKLLMSQVVFRHGERGPMSGISSGPAAEYFFRGPQQLTNVGLNQSRDLGTQLRLMYVDSGFLDGRLMPSQYLLRSSNVERTLMTATAAFSSMFRPNTPAVFGLDSDSQFLMTSKGMSCPLAVSRFAVELGLPPDSDMDAMSNALWKIVNPVYFTTPDRQDEMETLLVEYDANLPVPTWMNTSAYIEGKTWMYLYMGGLSGVGNYSNSENQKLSCGQLIGNIVENMNNYVECQKSPNGTECRDIRKFYAYSSHDNVILCLAGSLGVLDVVGSPPVPKYTSSFAFELWQLDDGKYTVKLLFRAGPNKPFIDISSSLKCSNIVSGCSIDSFVDMTRPFVTTDPESLCFASSASNALVSFYSLLIILISLVLL